MTDIILETRGLTKEFKGFVAVNDVNLKVHAGHIHAMIGPNGAGKTTVFNLLTKFLQPSSGSIFLDGKDITACAAADIAMQGMVRSFQISAVFPHMSVLDNVVVALARKLNMSFHFWKSKQILAPLKTEAEQLLDQVGLASYANVTAVELPYGRKRALELATTLALNPRVLLLDEPTQGMGVEDVERVTRLIRTVAEGRTVLMVEHNLKVVSTLADKITVLARGKILAEGTYQEVSANSEVMEAYLGTSSTLETEGATP